MEGVVGDRVQWGCLVMVKVIALGVFLLVCYLVLRLGAQLVASLTGSRHKAYRLIAARYGGTYESRGLVDPPTVSFPVPGATVRVGLAPVIAGQPVHPRTRVVARFAEGLPLRLELLPIGRVGPTQPPKGTRPVRIGVPEFDRAFLVQANDPDMARAFLSQESARRSVEDLRKMAPPFGMLLSINPERLLVQVDRNLAAYAPHLDLAVRLGTELLRGLQASVAKQLAEGIAIVAAGPADVREIGFPQCEVCGDSIDSTHVTCVLCKTPFHRDCWTFIGGCSTFGCKSKQCVSA